MEILRITHKRCAISCCLMSEKRIFSDSIVVLFIERGFGVIVVCKSIQLMMHFYLKQIDIEAFV